MARAPAPEAMLRLLAPLLALGLLPLLLPTGAAAALGLRAPADPLGADLADRDGDGLYEASADAQAGGPCGCMCPVLGLTLMAEAAGQRLRAAGASVVFPLCGVALHAEADPGRPDALGPARVEGDPWVWPPPRADLVEVSAHRALR